MEISRKRQDSTPGPAERFTGAVWFDEIGATEHTTVMSVHFPPGARTAWHSHPQGQVLHVTDGAGLVQSRGGDREAISMGDKVHAHPGEVHWHGAAPGTFMTHTAVQEGETQWLEHVTDDEYRG
jgi:quercetin dioxygenase-like cupin family protein